jgi:NAD(P)-dependent dehydrogenase (short-subunit alcohol dehydrogenase family)
MSSQFRAGKPLAGKVVTITGAASGIGLAFADRLSKEGADIAVPDLKDASQTRSIVEANGQRFYSEVVNTTDQEQVLSFAAHTQEKLGNVSILINNVGIYPFLDFETMSFADWKKVLSINLDSAFLNSQAFLPQMKSLNWGRIINMTSASFWLRVEQFTPYVTTKAAIIGFTRALSNEVGKYNITVNAIAPSLVRNQTTEETGFEGLFDPIAAMQVIQRVQLPDDLAGTASFLASEDASFITGQTLVVDGGAVKH